MDRTLYIDALNDVCVSLKDEAVIQKLLDNLRNSGKITESEYETLCEAFIL